MFKNLNNALKYLDMENLTEDVAEDILNFLACKVAIDNSCDMRFRAHWPVVVSKNEDLMFLVFDKNNGSYFYVWYTDLGLEKQKKIDWRNVLLGMLKLSRNNCDILLESPESLNNDSNQVFIPAGSSLESLMIMKDLENE